MKIQEKIKAFFKEKPKDDYEKLSDAIGEGITKGIYQTIGYFGLSILIIILIFASIAWGGNYLQCGKLDCFGDIPKATAMMRLCDNQISCSIFIKENGEKEGGSGAIAQEYLCGYEEALSWFEYMKRFSGSANKDNFILSCG